MSMIIQLRICWFKAGERGVISFHPWRKCAAQKPGSRLRSDLSKASLWRPWRKEALATRYHTLPHQTKSCGERSPAVLLERLPSPVACRLRIGAGCQLDCSPRPGFQDTDAQLCPPFLPLMWLPTVKLWPISGGTFLSHSLYTAWLYSTRNHDLESEKHFFAEVARGWWVSHFIFLSFI